MLFQNLLSLLLIDCFRVIVLKFADVVGAMSTTRSVSHAAALIRRLLARWQPLEVLQIVNASHIEEVRDQLGLNLLIQWTITAQARR